jgi:hypothetical protein
VNRGQQWQQLLEFRGVLSWRSRFGPGKDSGGNRKSMKRRNDSNGDSTDFSAANDNILKFDLRQVNA